MGDTRLLHELFLAAAERWPDHLALDIPPGGVDRRAEQSGAVGDRAELPEHAGVGERDDELRQCLARLPREQREILILRDYMDLSYAEIADVLAIAGGTVMSRLHRARMALRKELTRDEA